MFMQAATKVSCASPNQVFLGIIQDKEMKSLTKQNKNCVSLK